MGKDEKALSRRKFLGISVGATTAMAGLMAFGPREAKALPPTQEWHKEVDIVVIGSGAAGLTAAIEAKKAGADVLVLEKMPFVGGNTGISTAGMNGVQSELQKQKVAKLWTVDEFYEWTRMGGDYKNDPDHVRIYAEQSGKAIDFLVTLGAPFPEVTPRSVSITNKWGAGLIEILYKGATASGASVMTDTLAVGLIAEANTTPKKVHGVQIKNDKGRIQNIRAKKGVILATGGFGGNPEMVERHDPSLKGYTTTNIPEVSTGEVMCMAMSLGADTNGLNYIQIHPTVYAFDGKRGMITEGMRESGALLVNVDGDRFVDELQRRDAVSQAILKQKNAYAFLILSKNVAHGKIGEYVKDGFAVEAASVEELAKKTGLDPAKLKQTLDKYNSYVEARDDKDFKRGLYRELGKQQTLTGKINQPPFYSLKVKPGIHHCCGGLRINPKAQVMDALDGKVIIQNLYAAGEVAGGTHGTNRMGGNAITECLVFGRIAGAEAAKSQG